MKITMLDAQPARCAAPPAPEEDAAGAIAKLNSDRPLARRFEALALLGRLDELCATRAGKAEAAGKASPSGTEVEAESSEDEDDEWREYESDEGDDGIDGASEDEELYEDEEGEE